MSTASSSHVVPSVAAIGVQLPCRVFETSDDLARHAAGIVADAIRARSALGQRTVLGLATGSTPVGVYRELARMRREEGLSFQNVVTFTLDEYFGLGPEQPQSNRRWMDEHLFDHIDVPRENVHVLDGLTSPERAEAHCREFEEAIDRAGGIDVVLLGIGGNGHIGFNEPFSHRKSRTRLCTLDPVTRRALASDFFGEPNVPQQAFTMGLGTILAARKIVLMALGEHKAKIIRETCEGPLSPRVPATYLTEHLDATVLVDAAAGKDLTCRATPWATGSVEWTDALIKRALIWLCDKTGKALLKLDDDDFREHNLHQLVRRHGPAHALAHQVFLRLSSTIEYHPAGKERKRAICFSPHPDDDVISMGGTLIRLCDDGHEVHIAYMTSGNIAVFDHDAEQLADLVAEYNRRFGIDNRAALALEDKVKRALVDKRAGQPDIEEVARIKQLIRWSEANAGARHVGCREEHLHHLDLPFYRTGTIAKRPVGPDDVRIIRELIEKVRPDQVYVAGDLSDPHGTHRVCAQAIFEALRQIEEATGSRPEALLYRGAWQEYELHEIEIAVPLSPGDMMKKRKAIFKHESQKDEALFPGSDPREFWQRAEDRNQGTAARYNAVGLPEYFAMEAFTRWSGKPI